MTPNLNELADRLEAFIPRGDGYNSDYSNTLAEAVEVLRAKAAPAEPDEGEAFCDGHCTWLDHHPGCPKAEPTEAVDVAAWMKHELCTRLYLHAPPEPSIQLMTVAQHKRIVSALQASAMVVPDGYKLVPIEPTAAMFKAAEGSGVIDPRVSGYCYQLMLAASPAPGDSQ